LTQQQPAPPDRPHQQDQPDEPAPPSQGGAPTELPSEPELPEQPPAAPPPPPAPVPSKAAPKKRRVGLIVTLTLLGTLVVVAAGVAALVLLTREELPQVGDCLNDAVLAADMEVVSCDSAEAAWSVIGSDGTWTRGEFDAAGQGEVCQGFPATEQALWVTNVRTVDSGTEGEVICLVPIVDAQGGTADQ
jgi:hypothetical protein